MILPEGFWTPDEITPPQLTETGRMAVVNLFSEDGPEAAIRSAIARLEATQDALSGYLDEFGFALNALSQDGPWPARVVKIGAALAAIAYDESGYSQEIPSDTVEMAATVAGLTGIPDTYIEAAAQDPVLGLLHDDVLSSPVLTDHQGGYRQILEIGAGCTRYYLQHAIAA